jgi:lysophospholipase L1-like esterase
MKFASCGRVLVIAVAAAAMVSTMAWAAPEAVAPPGRDNGPWIPFWPDRNKGINDRVKQGHVDLIFVGDSITQLWEQQGADAWKKYYGHRNAVNMGIGGDQCPHVLWRLDRGNIDGISPKLAVVLIGTNDSTGGQPPEWIADHIKTIVTKLRTKLPTTKILLMGIFPRGADSKNPQRQNNEKTNQLIAKLADDKTVFYLDIGSKFINADGTIKKELMPDAPYYLHPSPQGYAIWAEAIEPTVKRALETH